MDVSLAEPSVIGGMILFPEQTKEVFSKLGAQMFESQIFAELFACCKKLSDSGRNIDPVTVDSEVGNQFRLEITRCCEIMPSISGFDSYVEIVREQWRKREMAQELTRLAFRCGAPSTAAREITAALEALLLRQRTIERAASDESAKCFLDSAVEFYADLQCAGNALKTGWHDFDYLTGGLQRQAVYVIAARSGMGKTDLALNLAMKLSKQYRVNYNSMEMPRKLLMRRVIARATKINSARLRDKNQLTDREYSSISRAIDLLKKCTCLTLDEQQRIDASTVEAKILKHSPDVLFIDHLGLMSHDKSKKNQWEAIAETTQFLKELALKHNIVIVELVQLNREAEKHRGAPQMSDLKGGSGIENDADGVFAISVEQSGKMLVGNESVKAYVHVIKNRHGGTGRLEFSWMPQYHFWAEIDHIREG